MLVVHHAKKGGGGVRAGQALRGSSEFHAWGDSNLYLRRDCDELSLTVEHRAAPSPRPLIVELAQQGLAFALEVVERAKPVAAAAPSLDERITTVLAEAQEAAAVRRPARKMPSPGRHPPRAYRPACHCRPHRQDRRRLPAHRALIGAHSQFPFPTSLQRVGMETGTRTPLVLPPQPSLVRPQRSFLHPGRSKPTRARAAAVKTGRRSLGATRSDAGRPRLDGREHGSTLHRLGAKPGSLQHRPSNDVTAAPSNSAIGLTIGRGPPSHLRY